MRNGFSAGLVLLLLLLAMGFCGWYENYVPTPPQTVEDVIRVADQQAEARLIMHIQATRP